MALRLEEEVFAARLYSRESGNSCIVGLGSAGIPKPLSLLDRKIRFCRAMIGWAYRKLVG